MNSQKESDSRLDQALDNPSDWRHLNSELIPLAEMAERVRTTLQDVPPPPHNLRPGRSAFLSAGAQRPARGSRNPIFNMSRHLAGLTPFVAVFALALLLSTVFLFTRYWNAPTLTEGRPQPATTPASPPPTRSTEPALERATEEAGDTSDTPELECEPQDHAAICSTQTSPKNATAAPAKVSRTPNASPNASSPRPTEGAPTSTPPASPPELPPSATIGPSPQPATPPVLTPTPPSPTPTPAATPTRPRRPSRTPRPPIATRPPRPSRTPPVRPTATRPRRPPRTPHRPTVTPPATFPLPTRTLSP